MEPAASPHCLNCTTELDGAYCHVCGQRADTERLTTKRLWGQVFEAFTDLDRGFLHTLKVLTVAPGLAIKDYLAGQRAPMYNPFRFYVLIAALTLIVLSTLNVDFADVSKDLNKSLGNADASAEALQFQEKINRWTQENMQTLQLILLPLFAFGTWFAFRKRLGYNYAEVLVLQCYISGYSSLVMSLGVPLIGLTPNPLVYYSVIGLCISLLVSIRFMAQIEGRLSLGVIWRSILGFLVYVILYLLFIVVVTSLIVAVVLMSKR
jgi:hypothetical protein